MSIPVPLTTTRLSLAWSRLITVRTSSWQPITPIDCLYHIVCCDRSCSTSVRIVRNTSSHTLQLDPRANAQSESPVSGSKVWSFLPQTSAAPRTTYQYPDATLASKTFANNSGCTESIHPRTTTNPCFSINRTRHIPKDRCILQPSETDLEHSGIKLRSMMQRSKSQRQLQGSGTIQYPSPST